MNGKSFVGNNEDYWNSNTRIWFEKGKNGDYGSAYVGFDNRFPQGGINEKGLAFDGLTVPFREIKKNPHKLTCDVTTLYNVMKKCQNIDEVYTFLSKYDLSIFDAAILLYVDQGGRYLVVEGDTMIRGSDNKYLLSNFCPSKTKDLNDIKFPRYQRGRKLMESHNDTSLQYLKTLSDTLHQSWNGNIGGTVYTTIYDLNEKTIHLYFYHDYKKSVTFKLADELNKKDAIIDIPKLFPDNIDGQNHLKRLKLTQKLLSNLKKSSFSRDSLKMVTYIITNDVEAFLPLYESEINNIGHRLLDKNKVIPAINIFKLNVQYNKNSWSAFESLADGYYKQKKQIEAKTFYKKLLELNPNNQRAIDKLKLLDQ